MASAPPGWYPDRKGGRAYWDGAKWTDPPLPPRPSRNGHAPVSAAPRPEVRPGEPTSTTRPVRPSDTQHVPAWPWLLLILAGFAFFGYIALSAFLGH